MPETTHLFDLTGQVAVITGGAGVLCGEIAQYLASAGVRAAILDLNNTASETLCESIRDQGGEAQAFECNVLEENSVFRAAQAAINTFGQVDFLINGAGGNLPEATTSPELTFFDLPVKALREVLELNLLGTIIPSQVFGKLMTHKSQGVILNISSMNAIRPLTRIAAYSAAKAGVSNFTQWLAVYMAREYSPNIRVNAIAPGFFLTEQNRFLLTDKKTGALTPRGDSIIQHTPQGRFGTPSDLFGAVHWLLSPASSFVTGTVVPVDGGFSAFSGV